MKRLFMILIVLGVYVGSLLYKNHLRLANNAKTPPTLGLIRSEKGIPVNVKTIKKDSLKHFVKISGVMDNKGFLRSEVTRDVLYKINKKNSVSIDVGGKSYDGQILKIASAPNLYTGLYMVEMEFKGLPLEAIGKILVAHINYKTISDVIVIDRLSVSQREEKPFVFIVNKNNRLEKKYVKLSDVNDSFYLVSFGLQEGDVIVVSDFRDLSENDFVFLANKGEN